MICDDAIRSLVAAGGVADLLADADLRAHLRACASCRELLMARGLADDALASGSRAVEGPCPSTETLAGFLDRSLPVDLRPVAGDHLAGCDICRREMLALADDLDALHDVRKLETPAAALEARAAGRPASAARRPRRRSWSPRLAIPLAAAAVLGLVAIGLGLREMGVLPSSARGEPELLRGGGEPGLRLDGPRGEVEGRPLRFAWSAGDASDASRYRLVVAELASGRVILDLEVAGQARELTGDEMRSLARGVRYHWMVTPLAAGAAEPSEAVGFTLR